MQSPTFNFPLLGRRGLLALYFPSASAAAAAFPRIPSPASAAVFVPAASAVVPVNAVAAAFLHPVAAPAGVGQGGAAAARDDVMHSAKRSLFKETNE